MRTLTYVNLLSEARKQKNVKIITMVWCLPLHMYLYLARQAKKEFKNNNNGLVRTRTYVTLFSEASKKKNVKIITMVWCVPLHMYLYLVRQAK